ncbi:MAG: hypothetical protein ACK5KQ_06830 [Anaerorhabdus sp.]
MVDQFLEASGILSQQLLPILGVIALFFLCVVLSKVSKLLGAMTSKINGLDNTLSLVEKSIEKIQSPLDTAVKLSHTVDEVHDKSYEAAKKAGVYVSDNIGTVKDYFVKKVNKDTEDFSNDTTNIDDIMKRMNEVIADEE